MDLAERVVSVDDAGFNPRLVCGIDVSYQGETAFLSAAVWDAERKTWVENAAARLKVPTEYVPGLFGYREGPLLAEISRDLTSFPDVFLVDGHGVAHPRRCGLACQFGLAINRPTIGVAKSLLHGILDNGKVLDVEGNTIGVTLATRTGRSLYVSVGHRISLGTASRVVQGCIDNGHPGPLRKAHLDSLRMRKGERG
jgi:deoxyribonuclease V